jgi:hypothetical protein
MDAYATTLLNKHNDLLARFAKLSVSPESFDMSRKLATALLSVVATHTFVQVNRGEKRTHKAMHRVRFCLSMFYH